MGSSYEIEVWDMINNISNICKHKIIKGIGVKRQLIHGGSKYKWKDGVDLHFTFENISFTASFIEHYEDPNDYQTKNLIVETEYNIIKLNNIKKEEVLNFLKYKLRVVKIEKLLTENNI